MWFLALKQRWHWFKTQLSRTNRMVETYRRAASQAADHSVAHVNWGVELAEVGELQEALAKFERAAQLSPGRAEAYTNWGVALAKLGQLKPAIEKFEQASQLAPERAGNYTLLGAALTELGELAEGKKAYEKAIELSPRQPEPWTNWGVVLARLGRHEEAASKFQASLGLKSNQPQVLHLWGAVLAEQHHYEQAIEKFKAAVRLNPRHGEALYLWSMALTRLGKHQEAIDLAKRAMTVLPDKPDLFLNLGHSLMRLGKLEVAMGNYRHALLLNPDSAQAHLGLGQALCALSKHSQGQAHFQKVQMINPGLVGLDAAWGISLVAQALYEEALPHLERALAFFTEPTDPANIPEDHPAEATLRLHYCTALLKLGHKNQAHQQLEALHQQENQNPEVAYLLGTHYLEMLQPQKAQAYLQKSVSLAPEHLQAHINLALIEIIENQTQEAVRRLRPFYRQATQQKNHASQGPPLSDMQKPEEVLAVLYYGVALNANGETEEAKVKLRQALTLDPMNALARLALLQVILDQIPACLQLEASQTSTAQLLEQSFVHCKHIGQAALNAQLDARQQWLSWLTEGQYYFYQAQWLAQKAKHSQAQNALPPPDLLQTIEQALTLFEKALTYQPNCHPVGQLYLKMASWQNNPSIFERQAHFIEETVAQHPQALAWAKPTQAENTVSARAGAFNDPLLLLQWRCGI